MASKGLVAPILLVSSISHVGENLTDKPTPKPVAQAAGKLSITEGTVRSRIKRRTLPTAKDAGTAVLQSCRSGIGREIRQAVGGVLVFSTFLIYNSNTIYKMLGTEI